MNADLDAALARHKPCPGGKGDPLWCSQPHCAVCDPHHDMRRGSDESYPCLPALARDRIRELEGQLAAVVEALADAAVVAHGRHKLRAPLASCPAQLCIRWRATLSDLSAVAAQHDEALLAKGAEAERRSDSGWHALLLENRTLKAQMTSAADAVRELRLEAEDRFRALVIAAGGDPAALLAPTEAEKVHPRLQHSLDTMHGQPKRKAPEAPDEP